MPLAPQNSPPPTITPAPLGRATVLVAYLVVVVIPLCGVLLALNRLIEDAEAPGRHEARRRLLAEIDQFVEDLEPERLIAVTARRIECGPQLRRWSAPHADRAAQTRFWQRVSARRLHDYLAQGFRRGLGVTPLYLAVGGPDLLDVAAWGNPRYFVNPPARGMAVEMLRRSCGMAGRDTLSADPALRQWQETLRQASGAEEKRRRDRHTNAFQTVFGRYHHGMLAPDVVRKFFTNKWGGRRVYIYCHSWTADAQPTSPVLGAYVVAFLDTGFRPARHLAWARAQRRDPTISRQYCVLSTPNHCGFTQTPHALSYVQIMPFTAASARNAKRPALLDVVRARDPATASGVLRLPFLRVTRPVALDHSPLRRGLPFLYHALLWSLAVAGLLALGTNTGVRLRWPLRRKLTAALIVAVTIPVAAFWLAALSYFRVHEQLLARQGLDHLTARLETLEQGTHGLETTVQTSILGVRESLAPLIDGDPETIRTHVVTALEQLGVARWFVMLRGDGRHWRGEFNWGTPWTQRTTLMQREVQASVLQWFVARLGETAIWRPVAGVPPLKRPTIDAKLDYGDNAYLRRTQGLFMPIPLPNGETALIAYAYIDRHTPIGGRAPCALLGLMISPPLLADLYIREIARQPLILTDRDDHFSYTLRCYAYDPDTGEIDLTGTAMGGPPRSVACEELASTVLSEGPRAVSRLDTATPRVEATHLFRSYPLIACGTAVPIRPLGGNIATVLLVATLLAYTAMVIRVASRLFAETLIAPFLAFLAGVRAVAGGDDDTTLTIPSRDEFATLAQAFNRMTKGLRERQRLRRFVSDRVIEAVQSDRDRGSPAADARPGSILVSDLRGFTTLSEQHAADLIVGLLNDYFTAMEEAITADGGVIEKFVGDALIAVFLADPARDAPALRACRAALAMRRRLAVFNSERRRSGDFQVENGVAVASGIVVSGTVRSGSGRRELGVYGPVVEAAMALEPRSKAAPTSHVVADAATVAAAGDAFTFLPLPDSEGEPGAIAFEIIEVKP